MKSRLMIYDEERKCQHFGNCSKPVCPALGLVNILLFIVIVSNNESKWRIISRGEFVQQRHKLISTRRALLCSDSSIDFDPQNGRQEIVFNFTFLLFLTLLGVSSAIFPFVRLIIYHRRHART